MYSFISINMKSMYEVYICYLSEMILIIGRKRIYWITDKGISMRIKSRIANVYTSMCVYIYVCPLYIYSHIIISIYLFLSNYPIY